LNKFAETGEKMQEKRSAYEFLVSLENHLNTRLPAPEILEAEVSKRWNKPEAEKSPQEKLACKENVFLYHFVLPEVSEHLKTVNGLSAEEAKEALLCEYHSKFPSLSSANAYRRQGHPFRKDVGMTSKEIMESWKKPKNSFPLNQAYPDLCLSGPFPFKIVFDTKYFSKGSLIAAEKTLVEGVYEAAFYRGLPPATSRDAAKPGWGYDFGCLIAYDASHRGYLREAWSSVASKHLFWEDAHVFVMILRGHSTPIKTAK
jgi:hypothetical protein